MYKLSIYLFLIFTFLTAHDFTSSASLQEMAGEMLLIGIPATNITAKHPVHTIFKKHHAGGVILFKDRNIKNKEQLANLINQLRQASDYPIFIAADQEGGQIRALTEDAGFSNGYLSAEYIGSLNTPKATKKYYAEMAAEYKEAGFNMILGPVVDLNTQPKNPIIAKYKRSYSADPSIVIKHASIFIKQFHNQNILTVMKHFPGHGSSMEDSHQSRVDISKTFIEDELLPYYSLQKKTDAIMIGHLFLDKYDHDYPASMSEKIINDLLINEIGFQGLIISDEIEMKAISSEYTIKEALKMMINAGTDVIIIKNSTYKNKYISDIAYELIIEMATTGEIKMDKIIDAYNHITAYKTIYCAVD